jgi:hypothetical protein
MVSIIQTFSIRWPTVKKRFKDATETSRELILSLNSPQTLFKPAFFFTTVHVHRYITGGWEGAQDTSETDVN